MRGRAILRGIILSALIVSYLVGDAGAVTRRAATVGRADSQVQMAVGLDNSATQNVAKRGRAAIPARGMGGGVASRAPTKNRAPANGSNVVARAGVKQNVIANGTKISMAAENTVGNESCAKKYNACIDSFCMLENEAGGRCNCSDKVFEIDKILAEAEEIDFQSYQLATTGIEAIETGVGDTGVAKNPKKKSENTLDLWQEKAEKENRGNVLFVSAHEICVEKIPECESEIRILSMGYSQQIRSDCVAYENSVSQKKRESKQKMDTAHQALRSAALTEIKTSNQYDLGQCTIEFKKCMQTTGGCGDDFSSCAVVSAVAATNVQDSASNTNVNTHLIKGAVSNIEISASTYEMLLSKKPLCDGVTKSCTLVADKVWDTFLKDVAPQLKNAELIAEDKVRQDCIGNISSCFQQACKENIDEKDPDGSYDMCLTRPETMLHLCKVQMNACGIDASSIVKAEQSSIWDYVLASLASMRVNACTTELKECLQSDDRCGKDYTQCIGLDTNTIIRMCPYDKLTGCQKVYGAENVRGDDVYDELYNMVQGIMINIDNKFLTECQNALSESMIRVCGGADDCTSKTTDQYIGAQTLAYNICPYFIVGDDIVISGENCYKEQTQISDEQLGRVVGSKTGQMGPVAPLAGKLDGIIYWASVNVDGAGKYSTIDEYVESAQLQDVMRPHERERVQNEINLLQRNVDAVIADIESDPTVQYCMTGRAVPGMKDIQMDGAPRFPELTKQTRILIANAALSVAKNNYYKKYDRLSERMMIDYGKIAARQAEIRGENKKDAYREAARQACVSLAQISALPRSPTPPGGVVGKIIIAAIGVAAIVVASIFTFGAAGIAAGAATGAASAAGAGTSAAAVGTAAAAAAGTAGATTLSAGIAATGAAMAAGVGAGAGVAGMVTAATTVGLAAGAAATASLATSAVIAGVAAGVAGAAAIASGVAAATTRDTTEESQTQETQLTGYHEMNQWNYKEKITTKFNWDDIECEKCVESQYCTKPSVPVFGNTKCKRWGDPETKCTTTKF